MFDILLFLLYILDKEEIEMAKYSAEELSSRINDLELDDDVKISLMEDITDSVSTGESEELTSLREEMEKVKSEYEEFTRNNNVIEPTKIDYEKLCVYAHQKKSLNPHEVNPFYVKTIEVEK